MSIANEFRKIASSIDETTNIEAVNKVYDNIISCLKVRANSGYFKLELYNNNNNNYRDIIFNNRKREILTKKLEHDGFNVNWFNGSYYEDGNDWCYTISW